MKVLIWHVHGSWTTAFVQGSFEVVVPVTPGRGPDGLGLPTTYTWPDGVREVPPAELADEGFDVVILQRPHEAQLLQEWSGLRAGIDVPAVYLEHNTPRCPADARHPMAEQSRIPLVQVTPFNALMWDAGHAPTVTIEHGIPDPGLRWTGELPRGAFVVNEPLRRGRITGTDLVPLMAREAPVDAFGMGTLEMTTAPGPNEVIGRGDVPHDQLLDEMARRRVYLHLCRWTSLGLALVEAMTMGMPVICLATTDAPEALAGSGAVVSNDLDRLAAAFRVFVNDPDAAQYAGQQSRLAARERYSLSRFHSDWDRLLKEVSA